MSRSSLSFFDWQFLERVSLEVGSSYFAAYALKAEKAERMCQFYQTGFKLTVRI